VFSPSHMPGAHRRRSGIPYSVTQRTCKMNKQSKLTFQSPMQTNVLSVQLSSQLYLNCKVFSFVEVYQPCLCFLPLKWTRRREYPTYSKQKES